MKVIAAVPHYNAPGMLRNLLAQLSQDSFDQIVVLDDASRDKPTKIAAEFPAVTFVYGPENLGAAGNRNRVLEVVSDGIVWFIDADMAIISKNNADALRRIFKYRRTRMIGGLIYTKAGSQMDWNYGHEMHPVHDARFEELMTSLGAGDPTAWRRLQKYGWDYAWLQPEISKPKERVVDWVAEGSFALPVDLFRRVGGYDAAFRYHEGQDLARRLRSSGAKVRLKPEIITRHLENKGRTHHQKDFETARRLFFQKHWGMAQQVYGALYKS